MRAISFNKKSGIIKFTKPKFKEWFLKRYPEEEKNWEKHYDVLNEPKKEEVKK